MEAPVTSSYAEDDTISLVDLIAVVVRHRLLIAGLTIAVAISTAGYLIGMAGPTREFRTEVRLLINALPADTARYVSLDPASSIRSILTDPAFVGDVYEPFFRENRSDEDSESAREQYLAWIESQFIGTTYTTSYDGNTRIMTLTYIADEPDAGAAFLDELVGALQQSITARLQPFIVQAAEVVRDSIDRTQENIAASVALGLANANGTPDSDPSTILFYLDTNPGAVLALSELARAEIRLSVLAEDAGVLYSNLGPATVFEESEDNRLTTFVIATITAFFLAVFLAFVLEYMRRVREDPDEMDKLARAWAGE